MNDAEMIANARLIAAAPELVAMLARFVAVAHAVADYHEDAIDAEMGACYCDARALLARIGGQ